MGPATEPSPSNVVVDRFYKCCFMSTETIRIIRVAEPRTATSAFTQLLSSATEPNWC